MPRRGRGRNQVAEAALRVALWYAAFGCLWIITTDRVVEWLAGGSAQLTTYQTVKGWFYVLVTAVLVHGLVRHYLGRIAQGEQRLRLVLEGSHDGVWDLDLSANALFASDRLLEMLGYRRGEVEVTTEALGRHVLPDDLPALGAAVEAHFRGETPYCDVRYRVRTGDGELRWLRQRGSVVERDGDGRPRRFTGTTSDITDQVRFEQQLAQAAKMEAMGRLAGGVAHDFNNLLTVMIGYAEFMRDALPEDAPMRADVGEILTSARRAAWLTDQLLAFSRKQPGEPQCVDLNAAVSGMAALLRRLVGEDIALESDPGTDLGTVVIDPGQLEQVLMNLAVNGRDAMPDGGRLRLATRRQDIAETFDQRHPGREPGRYVVLTVADDGHGMDAETREHMFEPFFTTKGRSQGTGLGLATCYGIVKQSGGFIDCDSTPGRGSVFSIYLPASDRPASQAPPDAGDGSPARGSEAILMVEDDEGVRGMARRALEAAGYRVTAAPDAAQALAAAESVAVDLLLTDVVMPGMDGATLATRLREKLPGLRVLLMSGYAESSAVREVLSAMPAAFLPKPFTTSLLTQRVREVLDRPA